MNEDGGCGECQRRLPTGGEAYGIPLKLRTPFASRGLPRIVPVSIDTVELRGADIARPLMLMIAAKRKGRNDFIVAFRGCKDVEKVEKQKISRRVR